MDTIREGLRANELEKDTFDRVVCTSCGRTLKMVNDPETIGKVRRCPECESEWLEMR